METLYQKVEREMAQQGRVRTAIETHDEKYCQAIEQTTNESNRKSNASAYYANLSESGRLSFLKNMQ